MTLLVSPYCRDAAGDIQWLDDMLPEYSDLAGLEHTRWSFWSSDTIRKLGVTLVTTLAYTDIYAEDIELSQLAQEIEVITGYVESLPSDEKPYWTAILSNVQAAIQIAKEREGGVYIG